MTTQAESAERAGSPGSRSRREAESVGCAGCRHYRARSQVTCWTCARNYSDNYEAQPASVVITKAEPSAR